ncbi:N-acetyltransferase family protein [Paenalkalicoccus suaedae]|uniref:N-acetyltransferase family protein n=1 Tax=Paenalkalicoccus suaedae TaxID=2592382 RepID=A0A859FC73_9BACI|nr:GNAT family N-acetyltransferase [Paenalkalicoccus suaedae]QKS70351.1 N-acetyltransferase family protein [Paenalkalicoccus suaedae]
MKEELFLRPMTKDDWPSVSQIYKDGIDSGVATFEHTVPSYDDWDRTHCKPCRFVATLGEKIVGFAALSPISARAVYAGVAEVSLYVANGFTGHGIGRTLLHTLIQASEQASFWTLQSTIFAVNTPSTSLHLACGFREVGRRERIAQREGIWHDTVLFERRSEKK